MLGTHDMVMLLFQDAPFHRLQAIQKVAVGKLGCNNRMSLPAFIVNNTRQAFLSEVYRGFRDAYKRHGSSQLMST